MLLTPQDSISPPVEWAELCPLGYINLPHLPQEDLPWVLGASALCVTQDTSFGGIVRGQSAGVQQVVEVRGLIRT